MDKKSPINAQARVETKTPINQTAITANKQLGNSRYSLAAKPISTFTALTPIPVQKIESSEQTSIVSDEQE